jgi:hypothetical protein
LVRLTWRSLAGLRRRSKSAQRHHSVASPRRALREISMKRRAFRRSLRYSG